MPRLIQTFMLCLIAAPAAGQTKRLPSPGDRVWVRAATANGSLDAGIKGTFEGLKGDSLRIRPTTNGPVVAMATDARLQMFSFTGRKSSTLPGAVLGGSLGALAGGIIGYVTGEQCYTTASLCYGKDWSAAVGVLGGVILGTLAGGIVGALSSHDTWARIGWTGAVHPVVSPTPRGLGLGVLLAF